MTGYKLFSGDDEGTESHNLVLKMSSNADKIETTMDGSKHMSGYVTVTDGWCVYRIDNKNTQKIRIKATKNGKSTETVYDLSGLTLSS